MEFKKIGKRIFAKRNEVKMSQQQLADALHVSKSTISRYESGDIDKIPSNHILTLAKVLKTTSAYLLGSNDDAIHEKPEEKYGFIIGEVIRRERNRKNLSLEDVGERMGLTRQAIHGWETGKRNINLSDFMSLCEVCSFDPVKLFSIAKYRYDEINEDRKCNRLPRHIKER